MKKLIFFFLFFCLLFASPVKIIAQEASISGEHIQDYNSKIKINQDGTIDVAETILYDFSNLEKHGIYREIPFIKTNQDNKKYLLNFENFSITDEKGNSYQFSKTGEGDKIKLKIGDADKLITGLHTYIISYKVSGALTYFSDHDELYWNATGNEWQVPIAQAKTEISLPESLGDQPVNVACYTGIAGSTEKKCASTNEGKNIVITTNSILNSYQGFTIIIGFPKNIVAQLEPKEYISFWETLLGKLISKLITVGIILLALFWYVILPILIPLRWYFAGRDPQGLPLQGEARSWFDPPKAKAGRPLTPEETGTLIDETAGTREISAMIISLAQKGYLKIVEKTKGKFFLTKSISAVFDTKKLINIERDFLKKIFELSDIFILENYEMYEIAEAAKKDLYEQLVKDGTFPENPQKVRTLYYALAGIALFTGNFHLAIIAFIFGRIMPRKTLFGAGQAAVARSLKNFLTSQSRQLTFQAKNQMFFEKLLPYAVAFGVEKIWTNRFKDMQMKQPDWYEGYYGRNFTTAYFLSSLNSSFSKINSSAMTPTRSSSGFSSGFSGGSSGGGGGGGGGGSW